MNLWKRILAGTLAILIAAGIVISPMLNVAHADDARAAKEAANAQQAANKFVRALDGTEKKILWTDIQKNKYLTKVLRADGGTDGGPASQKRLASILGFKNEDEFKKAVFVKYTDANGNVVSKNGQEYYRLDIDKLGKLYDEKFADNPYTSWAEAMKSPTTKLDEYVYTLDDFETRCSNFYVTKPAIVRVKDARGNVKTKTLNIPTLTDETDNKRWHDKDKLNKYSMSCADLWEEIKAMDEEIKKEMEIEELKEKCKNELEPIVDKAITNLKNSIRDHSITIAMLENAKATGDYTYTDKSGNRQCIVIPIEGTDEEVRKAIEEAGKVVPVKTKPTKKSDEPEGGGDEDDTDRCMSGGQAAGMSWVVCPIINALHDTLQELYDKYIEVNLEINPGLLAYDPTGASDGTNGTYEAWRVFRDLANTAFVILLLIVILSQTTGFGIDNYGIKRMLPKLIVGAILVNLSFIICQAAVDISNIIGAGAKGLLEGLGNNISIAGGDTGTAGLMKSTTGVIIGAVAGTGVVLGVGYAISGFAIILPVLLSLLSGVIGALFMFVLLAARKALVVLLVAVSPLAMVMYMLPNTNSLFNKWFNAMKAMLLVYPLCGVMVGGGYLAAKIILSLPEAGNDLAMNLVAILAAIAPFFAIPSALKSSMAAMGAVGAKLAGVGGIMQRGATGAIRKSEGYQQMQTKARAVDLGGLRGKLAGSKFGSKIPGFGTSVARQIAARNKVADLQREAASELYEEGISRRSPENNTADKLRDDLDKALAGTDQNKVYAAYKSYEKRVGGSKAASAFADLVDRHQNHGVLGGKSRDDFMRLMAGESSFAKTPDFQRYLSNAGRDNAGGIMHFNDGHASAYMTRGDDSGFKIGDLKDDQIVGASSNTLERLIATGGLTQADAQRIMANPDNRAKMDSVQQMMLAHHASHGTTHGAITKDQAERALSGRLAYGPAGELGGVYANQAAATKMVEQAPQDVNIRQVETNTVPVYVTQDAPITNNTDAVEGQSFDVQRNNGVVVPTREPSGVITEGNTRNVSPGMRGTGGRVQLNGMASRNNNNRKLNSISSPVNRPPSR